MKARGSANKTLILAAMIFAVSMTFIDMTIVAIGKVANSVPHDFALPTRSVLYVMAGVMAVAFLVALVPMPAGKVEEATPEPTQPAP